MAHYGGPVYNQQPMATIGMNVPNGGNRNAKNLPFNKSGEREWSNGLCGCGSDCGNFCVAWWCPCITYGRVKHRYDHLQNKGYPDPDPGCCNGDCCLHGIITGCGFGWVMQMMNRGNIRSRYRIEGGGCGDCCAALWCTPCELTQEAQELALEEASFGRQY